MNVALVSEWFSERTEGSKDTPGLVLIHWKLYQIYDEIVTHN